jgi:hypothetical protein
MQTTQTQPPRGAQPPQPPQQGPGAPQLPQQAMTPEQTRQLQVMSKQAMSFLLEDQTAAQIVQKAQQGDPQQVVADIVLAIMQRLYEAATKAGQQVEMVTLLVTGIQIIGDLAEMLGAAGVLPKEPQAQAQFVGAVSKLCVDKHNSMVQGGGQQPAPAQQPQGGV